MAGPYNITLQIQMQSNISGQLNQVQNSLTKVGSNRSFGQLTNQAQTASTAVRSMNANIAISGSLFKNLADQIGFAARRFVGYAVATSVISTITRQFSDGITEAIAFEKAMSRVGAVSSEPVSAIQALSKEITSLSTNFGVSSKQLSEASLTLKQAGFNAEETRMAIEALAKTDLSPTFDGIEKTNEGLIAAKSQFKLAAKDYEAALASINSISAAYAVESGDLIEAIKRAGGAFVNASASIESPIESLNEFNALFTSVRATTRESAESIATGLRTIFTRLQRGRTVDALEELQINLRYTAEEAQRMGDMSLEGQFVGAYEAVERLSEGLSKLRTTDARYSQVVEELGGYRQVSRVIPLLKEFSTSQQAIQIGRASEISLTAAAERAQETLANRLDKTRERYLEMARELFDNKGFQDFLRMTLSAADGIARLIVQLKDLIPLAAAFGAVKLISNLSSTIRGFTGVREVGGGGQAGPGGGGGGGGSGGGYPLTSPFAPAPTNGFAPRLSPKMEIPKFARPETIRPYKQPKIENFSIGTPEALQAKNAFTKAPRSDTTSLDKFYARSDAAQEKRRFDKILGDNNKIDTLGLKRAEQLQNASTGQIQSISQIVANRVSKLTPEIEKRANEFVSRKNIADGPERDRVRQEFIDANKKRIERETRRELVQANQFNAQALGIPAQGLPKPGKLPSSQQAVVNSKGQIIGVANNNSFDKANNAVNLGRRISDEARTQTNGQLLREFGDKKDITSKEGREIYKQRERQLLNENINRLRADKTPELVRSQFRYLQALNPNVAATELLRRAQEDVARVLKGQAAAVLDSNNNPIGSARVVNQALAQGVTVSPTASTPTDLQKELRDRANARVDRQLQREFGTLSNVQSVSGQQALQARKEELTQKAIVKEEAAAKRALIAGQYKYLRALNPNVAASELLRRAKEDANRAIQGEAQVTRDKNGKAIALASTYEEAKSKNLQVNTSMAQLRFSTANLAQTLKTVATKLAESADKFAGIAVASTLTGSLINANIGNAKDAVATDSESNFVLGSTIGSTLSYAGTGAMIGTAMGGPLAPILAPLFAVIAGSIGAFRGTKDANRQISEEKLSANLNDFNRSLAIISQAGTDATPQVFKETSKSLEAALEGLLKRSEQQTSGFFSSGSQEQVDNAFNSNLRREFANSLPQFITSLNSQVADSVRSLPQNVIAGGEGSQKAIDDAIQNLADGGNGLNSTLINIIARMRNLSVGEVVTEMKKFGETIRREENIRANLIEGQRKEVQLRRGFDSLSQAIETASDSFKRFSNTTEVIGDLISGNYQSAKVDFGAENLKQFGRSDKEFLRPLEKIAQFGGGNEAGQELLVQGRVLQEIFGTLQPIIRNAQNEGASNPNAEKTIELVISDAIKKTFQGRSEQERAAAANFSSIIQGNISDRTSKSGPSGLAEEFRKDPTAVINDLLKPVIGSLQAAATEQTQKLEGIANETLRLFAVNQQKIAEINEGYVRASQLQFENIKLQEEFLARREFRSDTLQNISIEGNEKRLNDEQRRRLPETLRGEFTGTNASSPGLIAEFLRGVNKQIPQAFERLDKVAPGTEEAKQAAEEYTRLQSESRSLSEALKRLTDSSTRSAFALEKLNKIRQDEESRRQLGGRFLGAGVQERMEVNRGLALFLRARQQGNFDGVSSEQFQSIQKAIDFLGRDTKLTGLPGGRTAGDEFNRLIDQSRGGQFRLDKESRSEADKLEAIIIRNSKDAKDAQTFFTQEQERLQRTFFDRLEQLQKNTILEFFKGLTQKDIQETQNKVGETSSSLGSVNQLLSQQNNIQGLGIERPDQATKEIVGEIEKFRKLNIELANARKVEKERADKARSLVNTLGFNVYEGPEGDRVNPEKYRQVSLNDNFSEIEALIQKAIFDNNAIPEAQKPELFSQAVRNYRDNRGDSDSGFIRSFNEEEAKLRNQNQLLPPEQRISASEIFNRALREVAVSAVRQALRENESTSKRGFSAQRDVDQQRAILEGSGLNTKILDSLPAQELDKLVKALKDFSEGRKSFKDLEEKQEELKKTIKSLEARIESLRQSIKFESKDDDRGEKPKEVSSAPKPSDFAQVQLVNKEDKPQGSLTNVDINVNGAQTSIRNLGGSASGSSVLLKAFGKSMGVTEVRSDDLAAAFEKLTGIVDNLADKLNLRSSPISIDKKQAVQVQLRPVELKDLPGLKDVVKPGMGQEKKEAPAKPVVPPAKPLAMNDDDVLPDPEPLPDAANAQQMAMMLQLGMVGLAAPGMEVPKEKTALEKKRDESYELSKQAQQLQANRAKLLRDSKGPVPGWLSKFEDNEKSAEELRQKRNKVNEEIQALKREEERKGEEERNKPVPLSSMSVPDRVKALTRARTEEIGAERAVQMANERPGMLTPLQFDIIKEELRKKKERRKQVEQEAAQIAQEMQKEEVKEFEAKQAALAPAIPQYTRNQFKPPAPRLAANGILGGAFSALAAKSIGDPRKRRPQAQQPIVPPQTAQQPISPLGPQQRPLNPFKGAAALLAGAGAASQMFRRKPNSNPPRLTSSVTNTQPVPTGGFATYAMSGGVPKGQQAIDGVPLMDGFKIGFDEETGELREMPAIDSGTKYNFEKNKFNVLPGGRRRYFPPVKNVIGQSFGGMPVPEDQEIRFNPATGRIEPMDKGVPRSSYNPMLDTPISGGRGPTIFKTPTQPGDRPTFEGKVVPAGFKVGFDPKTKSMGIVPDVEKPKNVLPPVSKPSPQVKAQAAKPATPKMPDMPVTPKPILPPTPKPSSKPLQEAYGRKEVGGVTFLDPGELEKQEAEFRAKQIAEFQTKAQAAQKPQEPMVQFGQSMVPLSRYQQGLVGRNEVRKKPKNQVPLKPDIKPLIDLSGTGKNTIKGSPEVKDLIQAYKKPKPREELDPVGRAVRFVPEIFGMAREMLFTDRVEDIGAAMDFFVPGFGFREGAQNLSNQMTELLTPADSLLDPLRDYNGGSPEDLAKSREFNKDLARKISKAKNPRKLLTDFLFGQAKDIMENPEYKADGGTIFKPVGTDTVPAMLTPKEYVVNAASAQANLGLLEEINKAKGKVQYRAAGGVINPRGFSSGTDTYSGMLKLMEELEKEKLGEKVNNARFKELGYRSRGASLFERQLSRRVSRNRLSDSQRNMNSQFLDSRFNRLLEQQSRDKRLFSKTNPLRFQDGGMVPGVGFGDKVPALLEPNEFVLPRSAVQAIGVPKLNRIRKYAEGGLVTPSSTPPTMTSAPGMTAPTMDFSVFSNSVDKMMSGLNAFSSTVDRLSTALTNFPATLTVNGTQNVNLNITGAENMNKFGSEIQSMIDKRTLDLLKKVFSKHLPGANIQLGDFDA